MPDCPVCSQPYEKKNGLQSHFGWKHPGKNLTVEQFGADKIAGLYSEMSEQKNPGI